MDGNVYVGLFWIVALAVAPVAMVSVLVRANLIYEACMTLGRRVYLFQTPAARPAGPPLEKLVEDLRRLYAEARSPEPGVRVGRQQRVLASYDHTLVAAARALDVPTQLAELPEGWERDAERFRLEHALTVAGLDWQRPQD